MIKVVNHLDNVYPEFQTNGNAARFCMPFALEICKGDGLDIGCNRQEWAFPNARMIDITIDDPYDATNLPEGQFDYIFSSHCLEHLNDWVGVLNYWISKVKWGGVIFLYLPDFSQTYWRPWNNRKHVNVLTPEIIREYLLDHLSLGHSFVSGVDAYNSFTAFAEKC